MDYERQQELKAFDESKAGVKGLADSGVVKIPKMFIRPANELAEEQNFKSSGNYQLQVPVIDLSGINSGGREKIIDEVRHASEEWGFFRLVNHGIPLTVLDGMIDGIRRFHEQDVEVKKAYYTRDKLKTVRYESNIDLYHSNAANWRDTLTINLLVLGNLSPDELPIACRESASEYIEHVSKLGKTLFKLLSGALGLKPEYLNDLDCAKGRTFVCHYYPGCPEPELTMGVSKHTDPAFLTVLLQDQIGGLQFLHDNKWVDVAPISGSLIINVGDLLQIISNGKFKSADHRVLANSIGPRISTACFFLGVSVPPKTYGPIKELISVESPPAYKEFQVGDYLAKFFARPLDDKSGLTFLKV